MTRPAAEERAQAALLGAGELKFGTLVRVADAIRTAIAERDARWREVVLAVEKQHFGVLLCHPEAGAACDPPCEVCPPLRALLAAGPTTERTE